MTFILGDVTRRCVFSDRDWDLGLIAAPPLAIEPFLSAQLDDLPMPSSVPSLPLGFDGVWPAPGSSTAVINSSLTPQPCGPDATLTARSLSKFSNAILGVAKAGFAVQAAHTLDGISGQGRSFLSFECRNRAGDSQRFATTLYNEWKSQSTHGKFNPQEMDNQGEIGEWSGRQVAWYVHLPKSGGSTLLATIEACLAPCNGTNTSQGPAGRLINGRALAGLGSPVHEALHTCFRNEATGLIRLTNGSLSQADPWRYAQSSEGLPGREKPRALSSLPPVEAGEKFAFQCVATPKPPGTLRLCGHNALHQHFAHVSNVLLAQRVRQKGFQPVTIGSVRNPFTFYVSWYFYGLERQLLGLDNAGFPYTLSRSNEVCLPVEHRTAGACVAAFRTWLRHVHLAHRSTVWPHGISAWRTLQVFYGENLQAVPSWGWIHVEDMYQTTIRVMQRVLGRPIQPSVNACIKSATDTSHAVLRSAMHQSYNCTHRACAANAVSSLAKVQLDQAMAYYDRSLRQLVHDVDREVFMRFGYGL